MLSAKEDNANKFRRVPRSRLIRIITITLASLLVVVVLPLHLQRQSVLHSLASALPPKLIPVRLEALDFETNILGGYCGYAIFRVGTLEAGTAFDGLAPTPVPSTMLENGLPIQFACPEMDRERSRALVSSMRRTGSFWTVRDFKLVIYDPARAEVAVGRWHLR